MLISLAALIALVPVTPSAGAVEIIPLNDGWKFHKGFQAPPDRIVDISLPHTWNATDPLEGDRNYFQGLCNYIRIIPPDLRAADGDRVFLKVGAANAVADVFVDGKFVMRHRGGYTAFVAELTDFLSPGRESKLEIRVNNTRSFDMAPVCGDFNFYGGLTRGAELIVTGPLCIAPDYHASDGVFFIQDSVTPAEARLDVRVMLSCADSIPPGECEVEVGLFDGDRPVCVASKAVSADASEVRVPLTVESPRLWDGVNDPFAYTGRVLLKRGGVEVDRREVPVGLRFIDVDADRGFRLNGKPLRLNGVNRHEDFFGKGPAMSVDDMLTDLSLIREMGCNAVRLSHYPQSRRFMELLDSAGIMAWVEIPFVNVYVNDPSMDENLMSQLTETVMQYYNHPSVFAWGLFNEINSYWLDRPSEMVVRLDSLAHVLDPGRPTMGASNQDDDFNGFTDLIAFNKYFGWYEGEPSRMGEWLDREHSLHPGRKIGISEYGAGASVSQQSDTLSRPAPGGRWHPENWQTHYHAATYRQLAARDYLWCNFIWCMFDFGSASRDEGSQPGINDKGLVTYDRLTRKDAFYFYKANWNAADPFVHIAGKREPHSGDTITLTAFTNDGDAELWVDGQLVERASPDEVNVLSWSPLRIPSRPALIEVRTRRASDTLLLPAIP